MKLTGNTVLITGGSSGIGFAMAEAFLAAGCTVIVCGRRAERLDAARARHPELHAHICDVSDETDRMALVDWTTTHFPALNVLVNNAGVQRDIDFTSGLSEFYAGENEIRLNLEAPVVLCGLLIPHLKRQPDAAIVNVSSGLGFVPAVHMPVYSAAKAGMHAFTMALREQLVSVGIKVFEVVPPMVDTELNPEGRAKRGGPKAGLSARDFVAGVMTDLAAGVPEIGYGYTKGLIRASRAELDERFRQMNAAM